jgi:hypothetical protein
MDKQPFSARQRVLTVALAFDVPRALHSFLSLIYNTLTLYSSSIIIIIIGCADDEILLSISLYLAPTSRTVWSAAM